MRKRHENHNVFNNILPYVETRYTSLTFNDIVGNLSTMTKNLIRQFYTIPAKKSLLNYTYFLYSRSIDSCKNTCNLCAKYTDLRLQVL